MSNIHRSRSEDPIDLMIDSCFSALVEGVRQPLVQAGQHWETLWHGRKVDVPPKNAKELGFTDTLTHLGLAMVLLIPIINSVVYKILKSFELNNFIFTEGRTLASFFDFGDRDVEAIMDGIITGDTLLDKLFAPAQERKASPEESVRRKNDCLKKLEEYKTASVTLTPFVKDFNCSFLNSYDANFSLRDFKQFYEYAGLDFDKQRQFESIILEKYEKPKKKSAPMLFARETFGKILDFLGPKGSRVKEKDENLYKGLIKYVCGEIIEAHKHCVDQVNSRLERIGIDLMGIIDLAMKKETLTPKERLKLDAIYAIFRYEHDRIEEICTKKYPNREFNANGELTRHPGNHIADVVRYVKHRMTQSKSKDQPEALNCFSNREQVFNEVKNIFDKGGEWDSHIKNEKTGEYKIVRVRVGKYDPEKYLIDGLAVSYGDLQRLRNKILLWAGKYFDFHATDKLTNEFITAISKHPEKKKTRATNGGELKPEAVIYLLKEIDIFDVLGKGKS